MSIGDITIGSTGYASISLGSIPLDKVVAITIGYVNYVSSKTAISVGYYNNGAYILGTAGATVTELGLRVLYRS